MTNTPHPHATPDHAVAREDEATDTPDLVKRLQEEERGRHSVGGDTPGDDDDDCVDEQVRETFPASDAPGNY